MIFLRASTLMLALTLFSCYACVNAFIIHPTSCTSSKTELQVSRRTLFLETGGFVTALLFPQLSHSLEEEQESDFIKELQARSAANSERYKQESMRVNKLTSDQFYDQYKKPKYTGIRKSDGTTKMVLPTELEELKKSNRIKVDYEIGRGKDGEEFIDYSKQILVLLESNEERVDTESSGSRPEE